MIYSNEMTVLETEKEIDDFSSKYGNEFFTLKKEDVDALLEGKTLGGDVNGSEYCVFIKMEDRK